MYRDHSGQRTIRSQLEGQINLGQKASSGEVCGHFHEKLL